MKERDSDVLLTELVCFFRKDFYSLTVKKWPIDDYKPQVKRSFKCVGCCYLNAIIFAVTGGHD